MRSSNYQPSVSVVVPVYNAEATLQECIDSLLKLNYPSECLELLLVNNGSTDDTERILDRCNGRATVLLESKKGPAAARNRGILKAQGEVIAFTDADCAVDKNWLQELIAPLKDHKVAIVGGKILSKRPCNSIEEFSEFIDDHQKAIEQRIPYAVTMNWASRASLLKEMGMFDEDFIRGEDSELSYRMFLAKYKLVYTAGAMIYHSNEKTLWGLFKEGMNHGYASIRLGRKHFNSRKQFGYARFYVRTYTSILGKFIDFVIGRNRIHSICFVVFNVGKKIGRMIGSIRFGHLEL